MKHLLTITMLMGLVACQSGFPPKDERMNISGHVDESTPQKSSIELAIPPVVSHAPIIAAPRPVEKLQTFTVVATNLPASELLFALARDARLNLDIDPAIEGNVSINAIDQTLPQILKRISRQVSLHYYVDGPNLVVERDLPFSRVYQVDYLNMSRKSTSDIELSTKISSTGASEGGSGGSDSSTSITNTSDHSFWKSLDDNLNSLLETSDKGGSIIINRESGSILVHATASVHETIQVFLDKVMANVRKQVLIEVTVVEVTLNDDFQAGVDWSRIAQGNGWSFEQNLLGAALGATPFLSGTYKHSNNDRDINAAIKALDSFGDVSIMSSPKIMALNNQTSILKVVDNIVYFEIEATVTPGVLNVAPIETIDTTIKTVPVGFVMNVTPFITSTNEVILNIRPTISRILRFVNDPNPDLADAGVISPIPEIQVREMESVLRVASGDTAVIGGLMQDTADKNSAGIPGLHDVEGFGLLFGTNERKLTKTELVIFLRPRIIESASIDSDLRDFKRYLKPRLLTK